MTPPVLLIAFNRPGHSRTVFDAIRAARPSRLFLAVDGPRTDRPGEADLVTKVRQLKDAVDWPCEVETRFRDRNLGCGAGPFDAISWFFDHVEAGIVLEDDCLPHPDFFGYCAWALESFRDRPEIWHVGGNNFAAPVGQFDGQPAALVSLPQVWGWASWADRWSSVIFDTRDLEARTGDAWQGWRLSPGARAMKRSHLRYVRDVQDAWDYQWHVTVLNHGGLALVPAANLITNIGDGMDATHTPVDPRCHLPLGDFAATADDLNRFAAQPHDINDAVQAIFERQMGLRPSLTERAAHMLRLARRRWARPGRA